MNKFIVEEHIKNALKEDIGFSDISTDATTDGTQKMKVKLVSREEGVLSGVEVFKQVFEILNSETKVEILKKDGETLAKGSIIATVEGDARTVLIGERTTLNYIQRMSGIATETRKYQDKLKNYKAEITDTRKTTPCFRLFEKYAVSIGGARLHRFNLSDCVMLKDNHIALVGSITKAVEKVRKKLSHTHKIEVECDTLAQVKEALECGVDIIMLDNMTIPEIKEGVELIKDKAIIEVSGNVSLSTLEEIAQCGVDVISSSAIVAKAKPLDLGLDV
ncbi:carboxylating nicotinate-nucleotide diphosphorylase [bacterium]|nr:carboxylating nicotinate-nucleotide diphosphorylase [bacterium]